MIAQATIRVADDTDVPALIELRASWGGQAADESFVRSFRSWWARERDQRITWLAEISHRPVGMLNLLVFTRMPRPDRVHSRWGYIANVFVREEQRGHGIGRLLVDAAIAYAEEHDFVRLVLSPSERSVPLYRRAGFSMDNTLMLRPGPLG